MVIKKTIGIAGVFLIGIVLGIVISSLSPLNLTTLVNGDVSSKVKSLYELVNPGVSVSVVKIDDVNGMYKVLFKAVDVSGGVTYRETFITKDGKLLTENMVQVDPSISQLNKTHNFVDCLATKDVKVAGIANDTVTLMQFNALGGSYATKLYLSCDGGQVQQCVNSGITQVPAVIYNSKIYAGVQTIQFLGNLTGCTF
ncbi:MAG: hypothetical protein HYW23_04115 [Candidatus Aenigmarchaeota archaeon]|nr:hypothetical protein [Candidatus Aenigmarchaeota archaeon]